LIQRVFQILFNSFFIPTTKNLFVLGDFPLKVKTKQTLLLHNPHIVKPIYVLDKFLFHRILFRFNHKYVSKCIVQTDLMKQKIIKHYPHFLNITTSILMPVENDFSSNDMLNLNNSDVNLFYPASFYKHKNHKIINSAFNSPNIFKIQSIKFTLTINKNDWHKMFPTSNKIDKYIDFVGTIEKNYVKDYYKKYGVLFYPSLEETFGLPLVEAMKMGIFIICSDLPYARLICGDNAIYFNPFNVESLINSIVELKYRISNNIYPNWDSALSKFPRDWDDYSDKFLHESYN